MKQQMDEAQREKDRQIRAVQKQSCEAVTQQMDEIRREKDRQTREVKQQVDEIRREKDRQLEEKDRLIGVLERLATLETHALLLPPLEFTVSNYSQHKGTDTRVDGPPFRNMHKMIIHL